MTDEGEFFLFLFIVKNVSNPIIENPHLSSRDRRARLVFKEHDVRGVDRPGEEELLIVGFDVVVRRSAVGLKKIKVKAFLVLSCFSESNKPKTTHEERQDQVDPEVSVDAGVLLLLLF